jgi:hypothetical protein
MFDSYGIFPDNELNWVTPDFKKVSGQQHTHLLRLLLNSEKPIAYNNVRLQGKGTSTCGRWCILRHKNRHMSNEQFCDEVKNDCSSMKMNPDQFVFSLIPDQ